MSLLFVILRGPRQCEQLIYYMAKEAQVYPEFPY
jgi:hypothetical protein